MVAVLAVLMACGTEERGPAGIADLVITSWGPDTVLQGTRLEFEGDGFVPPQVGEMSLRIKGEIGGKQVDHTAPLVVADDTLAWWEVDSGFISLTCSDSPWLKKTSPFSEARCACP